MNMEFTKEEYLKNRRKKRYHEEIYVFTNGVTCTIEQLKKRLEELETKLSDKENVDIWIDPAHYENEEYDSYLMVSWLDWESEEDYEKRLWEKKWAKERAVESLRHLIENNKEEALEIMKELNLV
jgi:hypothetical protein